MGLWSLLINAGLTVKDPGEERRKDMTALAVKQLSQNKGYFFWLKPDASIRPPLLKRVPSPDRHRSSVRRCPVDRRQC